MEPSPKATGWKIPLLVCAIMLLFVVVKWALQAPPPPVDLPEVLCDRAKEISIALDTEQARPWKEKIVRAASGLEARRGKDEKIARIFQDALNQKVYDAAVTALVLLEEPRIHDEKAIALFTESIRHCATLPWAVFAVKAMRNQTTASTHAIRLSATWQACQERKKE
ncbi:MAG: hypothetical protein IJS54_06285 [Desulfovibrio sp.]|nr:hypothetical protein [Desulfovibrio sp.]